MKELYAAAVESVKRHRELILDAERYIWEHAEAGYREYKTSSYMAEAFRALGYAVHEAEGITGFYADLDTGREGPCVGMFGELDALVMPAHPQHNPDTLCAHACGHNTQSAVLLGVAAAMRDKAVLGALCGRVRFLAVPAEELIEIAYREELRAKGLIKYFGGKVEFLYRGYLDGVDMRVMIHSGCGGFDVYEGNNGCITKRVEFLGKASHAAGDPGSGINALYAATLAMDAVNALRETFYDDQHTRVHPILTEGGRTVNIIPDRAELETYVRGADIEAIQKVNRKVNRAMAASAAALGAGARIHDRAGYMPMHSDHTLNDICAEAMADVLGGAAQDYVHTYWSTGSTDMGDMSAVMPVVQASGGGGRGTGHGVDFVIADPELAAVGGAQIMALAIVRLLEDGAARAAEVLQKAVVPYTREQYFKVIDNFYADFDAVEYRGDETVIRSGK